MSARDKLLAQAWAFADMYTTERTFDETMGTLLDAAIHRYTELEEKFRLAGGYDLERTAENIARGLDLDDEALLLQVGALSGGQRRRLELARLLLAGGDLLILDEPTNHLDAKAKLFVMDFLRTSPSAVLVVSHDIELMSESIDRVFALEQGRMEQYRGTYTVFLKKRAEREASLIAPADPRTQNLSLIQEGCCPGPLEYGDATLAPGKGTQLTFPLQMHPGMDGPHEFAVHVPVTSGPREAYMTLRVTGDFSA